MGHNACECQKSLNPRGDSSIGAMKNIAQPIRCIGNFTFGVVCKMFLTENTEATEKPFCVFRAFRDNPFLKLRDYECFRFAKFLSVDGGP